jgi:bla regulator protein blaR1
MEQRILVVIASLGVAVASTRSLIAQAAAGSEKIAFEAASIKPAPPDETRRGARRQPGGRIEIYNMTLRMLIRVAYESETLQTAEQFVGGPSWADTDRFNIVAKAEGEFDASRNPARMLRSLLEDRFKLRLHTEMRGADIYALVLARKDGKFGPEFHESAADCYTTPPPAGTPIDPARQCGIRTGVGNWTGRGVTMSELAAAAGRTPSISRVIKDQTGLTGKYDLHLEFVPPVIPGPNATPVPNPAADSGPSVFTAFQEQLGLKLQAEKTPIEFLVVDSAERPTDRDF